MVSARGSSIPARAQVQRGAPGPAVASSSAGLRPSSRRARPVLGWAGPGRAALGCSSGCAAGMSACTGWGAEGRSPHSPGAFRIPARGDCGARFPRRQPLLQAQSRVLDLQQRGHPSGPSPVPRARDPRQASRAAPPRRRTDPAPAPRRRPPPAPLSILGDRRSPARSLAASWRRGGRARAGPGRGRKVAAARRGGRGALTRMFTPGHPGKWKRRALLRGGEPLTPGPGPPPPPPPW